MKAKDYLISQGLAKPGRGRISLAGHQALQDAIGKGMSFTDYPKNSVPAQAPKGNAVAPVRTQEDPMAAFSETYPLDAFSAYERVDGKLIERSMREVCANCKVSLVQCECGRPEIVSRNPLRGPSHVAVVIKEKR